MNHCEGFFSAGRKRQVMMRAFVLMRMKIPLIFFDNLNQRLDDLRIKLGSGAAAQLREGDLHGERLSVWPVGRHGVKGIQDRNNPSADRNLLTRKPLWISLSVISLLMIIDHRDDRI